MSEACAACGEDIADGEAEFDQSGGRIGLPYHPVCLSMPESLKAKLSCCPKCGHMEGSHMDVLGFNLETGKVRCERVPCHCGCRYYLIGPPTGNSGE